MQVLVVVDMQNDFIDGVLGTHEAQEIVDRVRKKIEGFEGKIIFTRDTHDEDYLNTQEGKNLPVIHCMNGSKGHAIESSLPTKYHQIIDKRSFGSPELVKELMKLDRQEKIESITFIGICTDICVISNVIATKVFLPEIPLIVDSSCCAGVTKESHQTALDAMKMCQIKIV
ncbi:MAG: isochorismatase family cysteine hydrolase [Peptostreptococcaceae bacterium]|nr:isochorismatase family cysteine hydrolase [Peptostreptococcaceae bacterium]